MVGLAPINRGEFEGRKAAALAAKQEKERTARKQDHVKEDKKKDVAHRSGLRRHLEGSLGHGATSPGHDDKCAAVDTQTPPRCNSGSGQSADVNEGIFGSGEIVEIDVRKSLFDNHKSEDAHGALEYMQRTYSFFLPDAEYIADLDGMVEYLHQKVGLGRTCLYCQRTFRSAAACRQHMVDTSHCKIKYDDQNDMDEFGDFYDFSASHGSGNSPANGESDDSKCGDDGVDIGESSVEVLSSGELLITRPDGTRKTLGVRWLKRYYQQNARAVDERVSVMAAQRERLLLLYKRVGVDTSSELINDLVVAGAESNQQQSRVLSTALSRAAPRFAGVELRAARQHFRQEDKQRMKLGMSENWNMKHRVAKLRMRGEGVGVHG